MKNITKKGQKCDNNWFVNENGRKNGQKLDGGQTKLLPEPNYYRKNVNLGLLM